MLHYTVCMTKNSLLKNIPKFDGLCCRVAEALWQKNIPKFDGLCFRVAEALFYVFK